MQVRHCPNCGSDYRPEIVNCADCGGPLVDWDDESPEALPEAEDAETDDTPAPPPDGYEAIYTTGYIKELEPLADRLLETDIPFHLFERKKGGRTLGFQIWVDANDRERSLKVLSPLLASGDDPSRLHTIETEFEPGRGYLRCPACSVELGEGAKECPECGLPLATPEPACPECGAAFAPDDERCGSCGSPLTEPLD